MAAAAHQMVRESLEYLAVADPEASRRLASRLADADPDGYADDMGRVVDEVIHALAMETSFGRCLADGLGWILAEGASPELERYRRMVRAAAARGPTLAGLIARHLAPVLIYGDADLVDRFEATTQVMLRKGTYTLKAPLETLATLIQMGDMDCARGFLELLATTFACPISYNRAVYLTHTLPRAVDSFRPHRRWLQIKGLIRIIREDERLADDYIQGCANGLHLLSEPALDVFLDHAIRRYRQAPASGARFLSLTAHLARELCRSLQVAVPLADVRPALERYAQARTGLAVSIRPLSALPVAPIDIDGQTPLVHSDGRAIYIAEEMDIADGRSENADLFKLLVRLEAGAIEFGTFDLDAAKALEACTGEVPAPAAEQSDLAVFIGRFDHPAIALDLFTICDHARVFRSIRQRYPGLHRRLLAALGDRRLQRLAGYRAGGTLYPVYRHLVLGEPLIDDPRLAAIGRRLGGLPPVATATTSAQLAATCYPSAAALLDAGGCSRWQSLCLPFGRRYDPRSFRPVNTAHRRLAMEIHARLCQRGIQIYRSDLETLLDQQNGRIDTADIQALISTDASTAADLDWLDLEAMVCPHGTGRPSHLSDDAHAFRYHEWDWCTGDYLADRVRLTEHRLTASDHGFYQQALEDHRGLVKRIRYAFELLRPEAITLLRQWREGDAFDYRALLDYAVERKAGLMPSDRLFVKRIKRLRDVAALLLVDLSRSTANAVDDSGMRVLDIEKQAIVLLGEALTVVGDRFAIAGFSGSGPLGVDYYRIKDLDEPLDDAVKQRISAMAPMRSTRMGAAIRHAAAVLAPVPARVRLIIILGDGYPNDVAYKGAYAVEDTRRAVIEARAEDVHVKAITINAGQNTHLDRLYGKSHHTCIGDICDLPNKLVGVYSALTRH